MENAAFGKVLTDKDGKTLYFFSRDYKGIPTYVPGANGDVWPIFDVEVFNVNGLDSSLNINDFKRITRADGKKQWTYKGWPLYYYKNDTAPGTTLGDKVGNVWYVAKPDYTVMYASAQLLGHDGKNYLASADTKNYTEGVGSTFYLTDDKGRTLYAFWNDKKDTNLYTSANLGNNASWPIAALSKMKFPSILNAADFGTITVQGKKQLTYKGWPMYYFGQDTARGDNKGISYPVVDHWPIFNTGTTLAPL